MMLLMILVINLCIWQWGTPYRRPKFSRCNSTVMIWIPKKTEVRISALGERTWKDDMVTCGRKLDALQAGHPLVSLNKALFLGGGTLGSHDLLKVFLRGNEYIHYQFRDHMKCLSTKLPSIFPGGKILTKPLSCKWNHPKLSLEMTCHLSLNFIK